MILTIHGTDYRFAQLGLSLALRATPEFRRLRKELFNEVVATARELPVEIAKELVLEAFRDLSGNHAATQRQVFAWLATPEGNLWQFRTSLQAVGKQLTDEECEAAFLALSPEQWRSFDDFQSEPFRLSMGAEDRLKSELTRALRAVNAELTDDQCNAVFEYLESA